jgi:hypothetical protein
MLEGLHHVAYRCLDAPETVDFYTNVIGLKFAHAIAQDRVPSTQEFSPLSLPKMLSVVAQMWRWAILMPGCSTS